MKSKKTITKQIAERFDTFITSVNTILVNYTEIKAEVETKITELRNLVTAEVQKISEEELRRTGEEDRTYQDSKGGSGFGQFMQIDVPIRQRSKFTELKEKVSKNVRFINEVLDEEKEVIRTSIALERK